MKQYEFVQLNKGTSLSRDKDLKTAQEAANAKAAEGWKLIQVMSPSDIGGALYGIFEKEV